MSEIIDILQSLMVGILLVAAIMAVISAIGWVIRRYNWQDAMFYIGLTAFSCGMLWLIGDTIRTLIRLY